MKIEKINLLKGGILLDVRSFSPLLHKGHGSHPIWGFDLTKCEGSQENMQFRSELKPFVNNHFLSS